MKPRSHPVIEWLGTTPHEWSQPRLKAMFRDNSGAISMQQLADLEVQHYSIPNFDAFGAPAREDGATIASNKTLLRGGEILFSKLNCHKPRVWQVRHDDQVKVASTEFIPLAEWHSGKVDKAFIAHLIGSAIFAEYMTCFQTSVTNSHRRINPNDLWQTRVPLPPLPEQQRIAAYLDASCAAIDTAVAAKRRQLDTLDTLRKAIIQRAVTRGISDHVVLESTGNAWMESIPRGWGLVCLKRIAEIQGGLTLGKQYEGSLIERPYLRVGNVQDGHLDLADVSVIELPASVAAGVELRPDDVLMTEGGDLDKLGRGHLWKGEIPGCLYQNHIFAVRCLRHKLKPMFLAHVTASQYGRDYFEATGKQTTNLACTNATKVGEFPIPLPPLPEQEAICAHLEVKLGEVKRIVAGIDAQITTLTAYRKSLIHECVTGQRRVTEMDVRTVLEGPARLTASGQREDVHA
jgi:type I restriction enzyme, S subunit